VNKPLSILHIVRRYGPAGGMERYVWEVTQELAAAGHDVSVLCETCCADTRPEGIHVHELGKQICKPRWLGHLRFSKCVHEWLRDHARPDTIIHSHERTGDHHVTTFHSPPFARIKDGLWWKQLSPRAQINLWLEKREVCSPQVNAVVPNSAMTTSLLNRYYPCIGRRMAKPVPPGVSAGPKRPDRSVPHDGGVIGFIGCEWKRKGLDIAVAAVAELRKKRPRLEFRVAGPEPDEIRHLFAGWTDGFHLLGHADSNELYPQFDLLLHPARQEPYGMVIAEAMAAGVPVVISDRCGIASDVPNRMGTVCPPNTTPYDWSMACEKYIGTSFPTDVRNWQQVALDYIHLYQSLAQNAGH